MVVGLGNENGKIVNKGKNGGYWDAGDSSIF